MKLFQLCQKYMAIIGVRPLLPDEKRAFNLRNVLILLILCICFTAAIAFFFLDAQTLKEYSDCFFVLFSTIANFVALLFVIIKTKEHFQIIENLENMVQSSK